MLFVFPGGSSGGNVLVVVAKIMSKGNKIMV